MIKYIYTFFLGLLLSVFVGVGIATFYPAPKAPDYFAMSSQPITSTSTPEEKAKSEAEQQQMKDYQSAMAIYNRNASSIALGIAILILIVSLAFTDHLQILADGLLLGGVFTLVYSIGRGFASEDVKYQFVITSIGLIVALVLGYLKFIRPKSE